LGRS
jgi:hypothetical protein